MPDRGKTLLEVFAALEDASYKFGEAVRATNESFTYATGAMRSLSASMGGLPVRTSPYVPPGRAYLVTPRAGEAPFVVMSSTPTPAPPVRRAISLKGI